jgi:hypothetical protein
MDPQQLQIVLSQLAHAWGMPPPPPLTPDQIASGSSLMSQLLAALGLAGNSGDPADIADAQAGHAERGLQTADAMTKFPANEEDSSRAFQQLMGTAQQMPQSMSGLGQSFGGLFGGFFQALNQGLQQGVQAGTQMANSAGKAGQGAGLAEELPADALGDTLGAGEAAIGAGGAAGGTAAGLAESTAPAGYLGPPPTPSAGTYPASSPTPPAPPPSAPDPSVGSRGSMGGYPMMPPSAMGGAGTTGGDAKAETKRVVPPAVTNGAPVQGRITAPQTAPEVVKRIAGTPVASRRILAADHKPDGDEDEADNNR